MNKWTAMAMAAFLAATLGGCDGRSGKAPAKQVTQPAVQRQARHSAPAAENAPGVRRLAAPALNAVDNATAEQMKLLAE